MMHTQHSVKSDGLFSSRSSVLQADWFTLEINEKATSQYFEKKGKVTILIGQFLAESIRKQRTRPSKTSIS